MTRIIGSCFYVGDNFTDSAGFAEKDQVGGTTFQRGWQSSSCNALDTFATTLGKFLSTIRIIYRVMKVT